MMRATTERTMYAVPRWAFWWFAAAYALLVYAGRTTADVDRGPALVWPAAGVALLWLLARRERRWTTAVLPSLVVITVAIHAATGASSAMVLASAGAAVVQAVVGVWLLRRSRSDVLGAGGTQTISHPRVLLTFVVAAVVANAAAAVVAAAGFLAVGEPVVWQTAALWWGRNLVGMLLIGASGHLLLHALASGRRVLPPPSRLAELTLVSGLGLVSFVLIDLEDDQPLAFVLIATSVWCALRFSTVLAAMQVVATAAVSLGVVLAGLGPVVAAPDALDVLAMQAFVLTLLLMTLAIGSYRDARDSLVRQLDAARLEASEWAQHLETVTDVMAEGLTILDGKANLVRMNPAARAMLERTPAGAGATATAHDLVITALDGRVLSPEEHPSVRAIAEGRRIGPEDVVLVLEDGSRRTLSVTADRITRDGRSVGSVVVSRDVTDERRRSSQLAEFAATAAHDLRSPLTALRGWLDLATATADPTGRQALDRAKVAAARMQDLIADLLAQATTGGGPLGADELAPVPLDLVLGEVARYLPEEAELTWDDELPVVSAHPEMLRQLLVNLLGNAVTYVGADVTPRVSITAHRATDRAGDRVVVAVRDNGIGVPEEERERIFERLHRVHPADQRYAGTGLGLAICRTVVARHGGTIECRPAPGAGTVFTFDLPAAVPAVPLVAPVDGGPVTAAPTTPTAVPAAAPVDVPPAEEGPSPEDLEGEVAG